MPTRVRMIRALVAGLAAFAFIVAGIAEDVSDAFARVIGVVLVITALPPIMRRLAGSPRADALGPHLTARELALELGVAAGRVERIESPDDATPRGRRAALARRTRARLTALIRTVE